MKSFATIGSLCCGLFVCAFAGLAQGPAPPAHQTASDTPVYRVEVHVFRILTTDESDGDRALEVLENGLKTPVPKPGETVQSIFGSKTELYVHGEHWTLDKKGLNRPEPDGRTADLIQAVASPAILLPLGESAEIRIGEQGAQYFEQEEDGAYALRTVNEFVGYSFACSLARSSLAKDALNLRTDSKLREISDREPVAGLSLDVGKPNMRENHFETNVRLLPDDWVGSVSRTDDGSLLLTLMTIRRDRS